MSEIDTEQFKKIVKAIRIAEVAGISVTLTPEDCAYLYSVFDNLNAEIGQMETDIARRDEIIKQQGEVSVIFQEQLSRRDEIIARLKEDAERLADGMIISPENEGDFCSYCGGMEHVDDCPITLHRALMKELGHEGEK